MFMTDLSFLRDGVSEGRAVRAVGKSIDGSLSGRAFFSVDTIGGRESFSEEYYSYRKY